MKLGDETKIVTAVCTIGECRKTYRARAMNPGAACPECFHALWLAFWATVPEDAPVPRPNDIPGE